MLLLPETGPEDEPPGCVTLIHRGWDDQPSAVSRLPWRASARPTIVDRDADSAAGSESGKTMLSAVAETTTNAGSLDEQLISRLLYHRIILLGTEVNDAVANRLCINSPGGSVSAGLAIYDTMRLIPNEVSTLAMGLAGSMGQFLLCAGTAGKRFSLPHAQVLMHQGSAGFGGTAADVEIYAEQLEKTGAMMIKLIAEHTGQPVQTVERDSLRDRWFSAEEARDYGIIDHIVERLDDVRPAVSARIAGL